MRHQNAAMRKATEKLAEASISAGVPHKVDGQTVNYLHDAMGSPTPAEIVAKGPKAMHQAMRDQVARYDDDRQERSERKRDEYHENLRKNMQQLDCMNQLGVAPAPGDRVTGVIIGDEPPELRAQLWVDLLLAPSRKAVLGGHAIPDGSIRACTEWPSSSTPRAALHDYKHQDPSCSFLGANAVWLRIPDALSG